MDGGSDGEVSDLDVVGLFDRERDRAGDGFGSDAKGGHRAGELVADGGVVGGAREFGADLAGEIEVVRTIPSVDSWRRPSSRVRTALLAWPPGAKPAPPTGGEGSPRGPGGACPSAGQNRSQISGA